jgi:DNA invertase Pin-like site-specific DNA recombinase
MKNYCTYLRVSTKKQGLSGLGLEAQRTAVKDATKDGFISMEFIEIESGRNNKRPQLLKALDYCKRNNATLMVAKLDRLSRNAAFLFQLRDSGIDIKAADCPELNTLILGILGALAQSEAETTSQRTKAALRERRRISGEWRTGRNRSGLVCLNRDVRLMGLNQRRENTENNTDIKMAAAYIRKHYENPSNSTISLSELAAELNAIGFKRKGGKKWNKTAVDYLRKKAADSPKIYV